MRSEKDIEAYIEESKTYKISKYFRDGLYLDVKDEFSWWVAQILSIDFDKQTMVIHFDNWSHKYNEVSWA